MPPIRDESEYRKPEWVEGVNVVLGDGQAWSLPRPLVRYVPANTPLGFDVKARLDGDTGEFSAAYKAYSDAEAGADLVKTSLGLARVLLATNYELSDEDVAELLQFSWNDDDIEGTRMRNECMDVANGRGPSLPKA